MLDRVTITGADDNVNVEALVELTKEFPFVEWAILFSQSRMGTKRYPTWAWIRRFAQTAYDHAQDSFRISGHLCGKWVRDIEEGTLSIFPDMKKEKCDPQIFNRFQINWGGRGRKADLTTLRRAFAEHEYQKIRDWPQWILQCPNGDCEYLNAIRRHLADLNVDAVPLFDSSGGKGIVRAAWPQPWTPYCGYAGGLNPDNLEEEYKKIAQRAGKAKIWIDAESGIRDDQDEFDLEKVRSFLSVAASLMQKEV